MHIRPHSEAVIDFSEAELSCSQADARPNPAHWQSKLPAYTTLPAGAAGVYTQAEPETIHPTHPPSVQFSVFFSLTHQYFSEELELLEELVGMVPFAKVNPFAASVFLEKVGTLFLLLFLLNFRPLKL